MTVEVGAKLKLDDEASEALHHIKEGFEKVNERVHETQHEMVGMLKQSVAVAVGFQFDRGLESLKEVAGEFIHAAMAAGAEEKSLAGILAMSDKTGRGFDELKEDAKELHENLVGMGIDLGASSSTMIESFEMIASRSNKSTEEIKELVGQMAMVGKVLPGGAEGLAGAFRDLESGIVRPRNAIVNLIKQTGTAKGSVRDIAKGLSNMVQTGNLEGAMKIAETAIGRMSVKVKDMPLGLTATITSLKSIREELFKSAGEPMVKALTPALGRLRTYFIQNREKFEEMAASLGVKVGEWITEAADKVQEGFDYLKNHADEIKKAISEGVAMAREVVTFILAHKQEIALAFGAKVAGSAAFGALGAIGGAAKAIVPAYTLAKAAGAAGGFGMGAEGAAAAGGLAGAAAFAGVAAAAATAWAGVAYELNALYHETGGFKDKAQMDFEAREEAFKRIDAATRRVVDGQEGVLIDLQAAMGNYQALIAAYNLGNDSVKNKIVDIAASSSSLTSAFEEAGATLQGGIEGVIKHLQDGMAKWNMEQDADRFSMTNPKFLKPGAAKGETPSAMITNFNGGQTFHINQDFKDQDPDRVALVFRKDMLKNSMARVQARTTGPFGM